MKYPVAHAFLLLIAMMAVGQRTSEPQLTSATLAHYPPIARIAKVQGEVKVEFVLNSSGEPASVVAISGPQLLKSAAEENVKTWKFELPKGGYQPEQKYESVFNFKILDDKQPYEPPKLTVTRDSYHYVEVTTNSPSDKSAHDCPGPNETQPPVSITAGGFVELSRSGCFGTCPSYKVKVSEDGDVNWQGGAFVQTTGARHATIASEAARTLLQKFLSSAFWGLCNAYDASVTDNPTMRIEVKIGGRSKTVRNYADSAPAFEGSLENAVDDAVNTHLWRHGDPRTEPLSNINQDAYLPKPGVTPLMKAAEKPDLGAMKELIKSGVDIDATDSSGWTALMYAAASSTSEPVQLLLAAGANPNHKSINGDTPLMASAISLSFDEDLAHAGADINAKNSSGMTALMILAAEAETDEVKDSLLAGANPTLKDNSGQDALAYLLLANCGKSPVPMQRNFTKGTKCNFLDEDDVRETKALLKTATKKAKHKTSEH